MKKKEFLTEAKRKAIIADKEKAIIESFTKTFNKIKRIDENEIGGEKTLRDIYNETGKVQTIGFCKLIDGPFLRKNPDWENMPLHLFDYYDVMQNAVAIKNPFTKQSGLAYLGEVVPISVSEFSELYKKVKANLDGGVNENEINEMERFDATAYQEKNNFNPTQRGDKYNVQYEIFYCDGSTCGNHMWKTVDVYANSEEEAIKLADKELKHWEQFAFNGAANEFDELGEPMFKIERYEVYAIENESAIDRGDIERPSN